MSKEDGANPHKRDRGNGTAPPPPPTAGEEEDARINIRVVDQTGIEVFFKVRRNTEMKKVKDAFYERMGVKPGSMRFMFDGANVSDTASPGSLQMEEGDVIDCLIEQTGGWLINQ